MPLPATASTVETYGMPTSPEIGFKNFGGIAKTDPQTDQDASEMNRELADLAQLTRTGVRAYAKFTTAATTGAMTLNDSDAMWGNGISVTPVESRVGSGHFRLTFPATVTDPLGNVVAINMTKSIAQIDGAAGTFVGFAQSSNPTANTVEIYTYNTGFSANDLVGAVVKVWSW
jgi:hypothetical protein